LTAEGVEVDPS
jgi:hypothetical protein